MKMPIQTITAVVGLTVSAVRIAGTAARMPPMKGTRSVRAAKIARASAFGTPSMESKTKTKTPMLSEVIACPRT
jgi:hypothetical protein